MWEKPDFIALKKSLSDPMNPIGMRMRAAYFLKQEYFEANDLDEIDTKERIREDVIDVLSKSLIDIQHGSLMRHEIAYVMGQIQDKRCCSTLELVLDSANDCVMVRHEAAEALGAIGDPRSETILRKVMQDSHQNNPELHETCQIALEVMEWRERGSKIGDMPAMCACMLSPYSSVDPAPPHPSHANLSIDDLGVVLGNGDLPIFERYRAMFSLRNLGGSQAVQQLCKVLTTDTTSALLRHEISYVLGQMQHPDSVEALEESLRRQDEHSMVRHESAEALGAIEGRFDVVERILSEFSNDENDVVRESCLVALDAADYWGYNNCPAVTTTLVDSIGCDILVQNKPEPVNSSFASLKDRQNVLVNHFNLRS